MSNNKHTYELIHANSVISKLDELRRSDFTAKDFEATHREKTFIHVHDCVKLMQNAEIDAPELKDLLKSSELLLDIEKQAMKNINALRKLKNDHELYEQNQNLLLDDIEFDGRKMYEQVGDAKSLAYRLRYLLEQDKAQDIEAER